MLVPFPNQKKAMTKRDTSRAISIVALVIGFIGACFAFLDSGRTASRFTADGVHLGYGPDLMTWWWIHVGQIGFGLIAAAFALEFVALVFFNEKKRDDSVI